MGHGCLWAVHSVRKEVNWQAHGCYRLQPPARFCFYLFGKLVEGHGYTTIAYITARLNLRRREIRAAV